MQPRTRTVGGVTYMEVGPGQWQAQAAPAPEASPVIYGTRPQPMATPQTPEQRGATVANTNQSEASAGKTQAEIANMPTPQQAAELNRIAIQRAMAELQKAMAEAQEAQASASRGGLTPEDDASRRTRMGSLRNLQDQIDRVQEIYEQGFRDTDFGSLEHLRQTFFNTNDTRAMDAAGGGIANPYLAAFRVPGVGSQSDTELRAFIAANQPSSSDADATIEEKLGNLRRAVDARRAEMGLPEYNWRIDGQGGAASDQSTAIYRPIGQGSSTPDNQADVRQIDDPVRRGHAMEIANMMNSREVPEQEILAYHARHFPGENPVGLQDALNRRRDPNSDERRAMAQGRQPFSPDPGWYQTERDATGLEQVTGAVLDSQVGTAGTNYLNGLLGGWGPDLAGLVGGDTEAIRAGLEGQRAQNPFSALAGDIAGFTGAAGIGGQVAKNLNVLQNAPALRMALGDTLYGASYGAGSNPDDRLGGAALGGTLQGVAGAAGRGGMNALAATARGVSNPAVQNLRAAGVPLTTGQTVGQSGLLGQVVQGLENAGTSLPVVGPMIRNRQIDARNAFNTNTWDEALAPINANVGGRVGEDAAEEAVRQRTQAYNRVFSGRTFAVDRPMQQALATEVGRIPNLLPDFRANMDAIINNQVGPMLARGDVQGALRAVKEGRSAVASQNGSGEAVRSLGAIEAGIQRMMQRQHPGAYRELRNADRAFRLSAIAQAATTAGRDNPLTPGVFTPRQLGTAASQNARTFGGRDLAASTQRPFYQSQRDAQTVLPENLPNSGTPERLFVGGALLGGAGTVDAFGGAGTGSLPAVGALGGLAALYTRPGQRLVNGMLAARPQAARDAADFMVNRPIALPGPQLKPPFTTDMTLGQILGAITGTTINSNYGAQAADRPY